MLPSLGAMLGDLLGARPAQRSVPPPPGALVGTWIATYLVHGTLLAAGAWAVSHYVMETSFAIAWPPALGIVGGGATISLLAGLAFALGPVSARPARVLRSRE